SCSAPGSTSRSEAEETAGMRPVPLEEVVPLVEGALGVRLTPDHLRPLRLPLGDLDLHHPMLRMMAAAPAGVRLRLSTDSSVVRLRVEHIVAPGMEPPMPGYDLTVQGEVVSSRSVPATASSVELDGLPGGGTVAEIWLPH